MLIRSLATRSRQNKAFCVRPWQPLEPTDFSIARLIVGWLDAVVLTLQRTYGDHGLVQQADREHRLQLRDVDCRVHNELQGAVFVFAHAKD